jgi:hypothetical protein
MMSSSVCYITKNLKVKCVKGSSESLSYPTLQHCLVQKVMCALSVAEHISFLLMLIKSAYDKKQEWYQHIDVEFLMMSVQVLYFTTVWSQVIDHHKVTEQSSFFYRPNINTSPSVTWSAENCRILFSCDSYRFYISLFSFQSRSYV